MSNLSGSVKFRCADCPQMKDTPQELLDWIGDHDLDLDIWCNRCSKLIDEITLEQAQWLKENRLGIQGICKDCSSVFFITPEEAVWLLENELKLFKRCSCCRQKNKEQRENKQIQMDLEAAVVPLAIAMSGPEDMTVADCDWTVKAVAKHMAEVGKEGIESETIGV